MPRVTPIASKADVAPEHQAVVDDVLGVFGAIRGPFSMMLHSPEMTKRLLPLVPFFRVKSVVEGKLRSVGILAAVREREAATCGRRRSRRRGATACVKRRSISYARRPTRRSFRLKRLRS